MFAIPKHPTLLLIDDLQQVFAEPSGVQVNQIQEMQVGPVEVGPKGGCLAIHPNGEIFTRGEIELMSSEQRPAIFEIICYDSKSAMVKLPKNIQTPWQSNFCLDTLKTEWLVASGQNRFKIRTIPGRISIFEIGLKIHFKPQLKRLSLEKTMIAFDINVQAE